MRFKSGQICEKCYTEAKDRYEIWGPCTIDMGNHNGAEGHRWNRNPIEIPDELLFTKELP